MQKTMTFVLRKVGGSFDAVRGVLGMGNRSGRVHASRRPSLLMTVVAVCSMFLVPLLAAVAVAACAAISVHAGHAVAGHPLALAHLTAHGAIVSGAGLAIGETATADLKKVHDDLQAVTKQLRETNEQALAEIKKTGTESSETKAQLERVQKAMDSLEIKMQRALTAGRSESVEHATTEKEEKEIKAFEKFVKSGDIAEYKALTTDSNPDGGYAVPNVLADRIINKLIQFSNVRDLVTVETIGKGSGLDIPAEGAQNFAAGWTGERSSRSETTEGQLRMEKIPAHEMYAKPLISQTQLDDEAFDLEQWASDRVARRLAVIEGAAFVNGVAVTQPEGFMTNTGVASVVSGAAAAITVDGMFDLMASLPTPYAMRATIVANRKTKYALRKLKDSQNRYLWEPSLVAGTPAAFDQTPFIELVDMPDIAASSFPVAFGDFKSAYTIVDRQGLRLLRDPFTSKPFIELYFTKRTGGQVVLTEALRKLQCHT